MTAALWFLFGVVVGACVLSVVAVVVFARWLVKHGERMSAARKATDAAMQRAKAR